MAGKLRRALKQQPIEMGAAASDLARLAASASALSREESVKGLLEATARELTGLLEAAACVISEVEGDLVHETASYWPGNFGSRSPFADHSYLLDDYPLTRAVLEAGRIQAISFADDVVEPNEAFVLRELGMQALLMLPLNLGTQAWGLVEVYDREPRRFDGEDRSLAELIVRQASGLLAQFEHAEAVERLYRETLASLANALEAKDAYTSHHAQEVVALAVEVAERLGISGDALRAVELGALLHDIGKIRVPESILLKPSSLDEDEWTVMRRHPEVGQAILAPIASLADVLPVVRSSHERWDGRGYPDRLAGEKIPLGARIVAVCDAYRAMIEPRPYRAALPVAHALAELHTHAGTQFDPRCVRALLTVLEEQREIEDRAVLLHRPALIS